MTGTDNATFFYFTWGTLKAGFPNHDKHKDILGECVGTFETCQPYPLAVPYEACCPNPRCAYTHCIGALIDRPGEGAPVTGEVYRVTADDLAQLDEQENYDPDDPDGSTYIRRSVALQSLEGKPAVEGQLYFIADAEQYDCLLARGLAEAVETYTLEMAQGPKKPCCAAKPEEHVHDVQPLPKCEPDCGGDSDA